MRVVYSIVISIVVSLGTPDFANGDPNEATHSTSRDILYRNDDGTLTDSMKARCRLDIRAPSGAAKLPVVVWFHGGGLTGGMRSFPSELNRKDLVVVTVEYRLHPDVKAPECIEDAAASVAWVFQHIEEVVEHTDVTLHELNGFDHGGMAAPAFPLLIKFVHRVTKMAPQQTDGPR